MRGQEEGKGERVEKGGESGGREVRKVVERKSEGWGWGETGVVV